MTKLVVIDLDELVDPVGRVSHKGKQYDVLPVSGVAFDLSEQIRSSDKQLTVKDKLEYTYKILAELVPSMAEQERRRLNPKQISAIIRAAGGPTAKVNAMAKARTEKNGRRRGKSA